MNYSRFSKINYSKDSVGEKGAAYIKSCKINKRSVTGVQQVLIEKMLKADNLNSWERKFLVSVLDSRRFSNKQKHKLNNIYKKTTNSLKQ